MELLAYGFRIEFWGDRACFTRPELKVERMSYDVPTPSALRGMLEAVYWHPGMRWCVDRIHVLNRIAFTNVRRNEVKSKGSMSAMRSAMLNGGELPYLNTKEDIQQRASLVLRDVRYVVEAHFELTDDAGPSDNPGKFQAIASRRFERGQCYSQPYFGCREFPAYFGPYEGQSDPKGYYTGSGERDLGLMLYDMDFSDPADIMPMFYRVTMRDGVIEVPPLTGSEVLR